MILADTALIGCGPDGEIGAPTAADVGGKAHHLLRMAQLGLPVPPAFVLGTRHCKPSLAAGALSDEVRAAWPALLPFVESASTRRFGDAQRPLLVSVRSGAPVSMPGMMQTLLNVGLSDLTLPGVVRVMGNPRLAWDAYRRLIAQFGEVAAGIAPECFEREQAASGPEADERTLDFAQLRALARRYLDVYREAAGEPFPQAPREQLERAIAAVFQSWESPHACRYRSSHGIPATPGTAVIVQAMVFGNAGGTSGAGVAFTRDPATGESALWADFLPNAQGEDVVSGRRVAHGSASLAAMLPNVWTELTAAAGTLEHAFGDMQDLEFTVEAGRLYLLQARSGKRSDLAALRILLDLHDEGILSADAALQRAAALDTDNLTTRRVVAEDGRDLERLATAASANGGVAIGEIALDEDRARARVAAGVPVLLVRRDAETADLAALEIAQGLLTQRGARTSHAAVVARQLGKVCLVGCQSLTIDLPARRIFIDGREFAEGATLTLDGNNGCVYAGAARTAVERPCALLERLASLRRSAADATLSTTTDSAAPEDAAPTPPTPAAARVVT